MKKLSANYGKHLSLITQQKQNDTISNSPYSNTSQTIFKKQQFTICDIIGNFQNAFIVIHSNGVLYLVDQHAASQKSLYMQLINKNNLFPVNYKGPTLQVQNIYKQILEDQKQKLQKLGWYYNINKYGSVFIEIQLMMVPSLIGRTETPENFIQIIQKMYLQNDQQYSKNQKESLASTACHSAFRIGHQLSHNQMRGLLDSLGLMDASFNCPHGRPTIICLGKVSQLQQQNTTPQQYLLL